jgi:uncharacterized membrane protein
MSAAVPSSTLPESAYRRIALVLRGGLLLSLAILVAGLAVYRAKNPGTTSSAALATNPILGYLGVTGLAAGLAAGAPAAYLTLGLLVLVATPIVRVLAGLYSFHWARERAMEAVTATVLVLLLFGLLVLGPLIR